MHYVYAIVSSFIAGAVVSAMYFKSAKAFAEAELKKVRDELNALKSKVKSRL